MSKQLESPGLRPFQSLHRSFLCTPADSFLNGSTVSSPRYSTDDSFRRGMKKNMPALKSFAPIFTVDKPALEHQRGIKSGVDHSDVQRTRLLYPLLDFCVRTGCCSPSPLMVGKRGHRKDAGFVQREV